MQENFETLTQFKQRLQDQIYIIEAQGVPPLLEKRLTKAELLHIFAFTISIIDEKNTVPSTDQADLVWTFQRKDYKRDHIFSFFWNEYKVARSISIIKPSEQSNEFQLFVNVKSKKAGGWKGNFAKVEGNSKKGKDAYRIDHIDNVESYLELVNKWDFKNTEVAHAYEESISNEITIGQRLDPNYIVQIQEGGKFVDSKGIHRHRVFSPKASNTLADFIEQKPFLLNRDQLNKLQAKLLSMLQYLHSQKIIHGDLKAANVVLDKNLNPKFIDLGEAKKDFNSEKNKDIRGLGQIFLSLENAFNKLSTKEDYLAIDTFKKQHPVISLMLFSKETTVDQIIEAFQHYTGSESISGVKLAENRRS